MRRVSVRLLTLTLFASLGLSLVGGSASAQSTATRAIVLRFDGGARGDRARTATVAELAPLIELVTESRAIATAQEMGVDVSTPEGMAQVVHELDVALVVMGAIQGRGRRARTIIVVVDPDSEELSRREGPEPRGAANLAEIGRLAAEAVEDAMATLEERARPPAPPDPEPPAPIVYEETPETPDAATAPRAGWRHPLALLQVGLRSRTVGIYVDEQTTNRQFLFESQFYPEIEAAMAFRPFTDSDEAALRGLYLGLVGSFSVGLTYVDDAARGERSATTYRFRVDAGYGHTFADIFELMVVLGFGMDGLELDMPVEFWSSNLSYLRLAAIGRIRLYEQVLAAQLSIGGRLGVDGGGLTAAFGDLFFGGVDLSVGFYGVIAPGFTWEVSLGYVLHSLGFDGSMGALGTGSNGIDETVELRALVGWAF